jgi:hypothetical protein
MKSIVIALLASAAAGMKLDQFAQLEDDDE